MDGSLDISDAIAALKFLFTRRDRQICAVLCDVDEDGELSISDPIAILNYLFQGEPFRAPLPVAEELCDGIDNDCNGLMDEDCPTGGGVSVQLAWDPVTKDVKGLPEDVAGYQVHFGRSSGDYPHLRDAGNATRYELTGLVPEVRYYFAVKTYDRSRNVSDFSNEVSVLAGR